MLYDLIIIGSGPAGLAAAIYAKRAELNAVIIEKAPMSGGQIINTYEVDNYPGIPGISGYELAVKFREHCNRLEASFMTGEVSTIEDKGNVKEVKLSNGEVLLSKTILIATGAAPRHLEVPGEEKLSGMGVSYCATCDGAFFRQRDVAVVGGGDVAIEDAIFLARICKKVHVIHRRDEFRAAKSLVSRLQAMENVEFHYNSVVEEIYGGDMVSGVRILNKEDKKTKDISLEGVFIAVGNIPDTKLYASMVECDKGGFIIADETCATNVSGIFVAGDVRTKELRQIITAAADGANAITAVEKYLNGVTE